MKKIAALILLTLGAAAAQAQQVYIGGTVGEAYWNTDCTGVTDCSTRKTGYNAIVGYTFDSHWAIEGSLFSLGTINGSVDGIEANIKGTGADVAAVYRATLYNNWGWFAKLGVSENRAEPTASMNGVTMSFDTTNKASLVGGVGVTYSVTPKLAFRADVQTRRVSVDVQNEFSSGNVTSVNLGVLFAF